MTTYTLSSGCFWCFDAVARQLRGVARSVCGYTGGERATATYRQVLTGRTGHAETVQVTFDETILPADILLDIYFAFHDPTSLNQQGADVGPQYASVMWYADTDQELTFIEARDRAQQVYKDKIVTRIEKLDRFYPAETEHQDYFSRHPDAGYCRVVIDPKVAKVRKQYAQYIQS